MIPLYLQFKVEKERNLEFQFLAMAVSMLLPLAHGILFYWIPRVLRTYRGKDSLRGKPFFTFLKYYGFLTRTFNLTVFGKTFYYQPSLLIVVAMHLGINGVFAFSQTKDLDYEPRYYVVSKRIGRLSTGNLPMILLFVSKNTLVSALSGLGNDKTVFFHKWLGRFMFLSATIHMALSLKYWLEMKFYIMVEIPPQIFGMIAYGCLTVLSFASLRFIRNFAFEFFLAQHRIFNFIMLLMLYFHSKGNRAAVILGVHLLVLDRISSRVLGILHKRKGPTKGMSKFEVLDEDTVRITIPIKVLNLNPNRWWWCFVPKYGNWAAGQHVLLNVFLVKWLQYHPFTIASLPSSGNMVFVVRVKTGFTKHLMNKVKKLSEEQGDLELTSESSSSSEIGDSSLETNESPFSVESSSVSIEPQSTLIEKLCSPKSPDHYLVQSKSVRSFKLVFEEFETPEHATIKAGINGPYGGIIQPLTKFESVIFFSAGSGASFILPLAIDLLQTIQKKDLENDYLYRPAVTTVTIVMSFRRKANLQWYDHLYDDLVPFIDLGRAQLIVHISQEEAETISTISDEKKQIESDCSVYTDGNEGFALKHSRIDFASYILPAGNELCSTSRRKAFASLSCGPHAFNEAARSQCDKVRSMKGAPDVYCYTESFD